MPPSSRIDIPVGFQGIVRLRLDPVIELTPSTARQQLSDPANAPAGVERRISLTGTCTNLAGDIPCSLEWLVESDDWDTAVRTIPETRGPLAVRGQGGKYVVVLDGKPLSTVDIIKLGLVGRGKLGYRIVPAVKNPLEVPPDRSPISFDFRARLAPQGELEVGSLVRLLPDFDPVFNNQRVRLTIFEQIDATERPRHVYEWTVGDRDEEDDIVWRVGCREALAPTAPGTSPDAVEQRLLPPILEYIDHLEGESGKLEHRLRLEFVPPPKPGAKKQAEPLCSLIGAQRLDAPMPRLTAFELELRRGPRLVASGAFSGFHESLDIPLELELHGIRPPDADGGGDTRPHPLRELILDVCPPELQTSIAGERGRVGAAIERLLSAETGAIARPHRSSHTFEAVLLDFTTDDGKALAPLWKAVHAAGYRVFAELRISETITDNKPTPVVFVARYRPRTEPDDDDGFVPIGHGVLGPPLTSLGVGSNLIDVSGHSSELVPPGRAIERVREDQHDDLKWFIACVVGEARNSSAVAQRAVGHSIINRIGRREWSATRSVKDVVTFKSAYECYGGGKKVKNFVDGENYADRYIATRGNVEGRDAVLDDLIEATLPVFLGEAGDGHDVTLYFSPSAQRQLGRTAPEWALSSQLEDITDLLLAGSRDDFRFYRYKPKP
jgi:hypothetical protein